MNDRALTTDVGPGSAWALRGFHLCSAGNPLKGMTMSHTIQEMIYVSKLQEQVEIARTIERNHALFSDFREVSRYYVSAAELGTDTEVEEYYKAIISFYERKEDVLTHFWMLGATFLRSLAEMRVLIAMNPSDLLFGAMQREIDESFDFFTYAWEIEMFSDEAYERLCELNDVSQARLEQVMSR